MELVKVLAHQPPKKHWWSRRPAPTLDLTHVPDGTVLRNQRTGENMLAERTGMRLRRAIGSRAEQPLQEGDECVVVATIPTGSDGPRVVIH